MDVNTDVLSRQNCRRKLLKVQFIGEIRVIYYGVLSSGQVRGARTKTVLLITCSATFLLFKFEMKE